MNFFFNIFFYALKFLQWLADRKTIVLLLTLLVANIVWKYKFINYHSIWGDESYAIWLALHLLKNIIADVQKGADAPLYYLVLHFWVKLFGIGEAAVKSLSIIFSTGALLFFFLFVKKISNVTYAFLAGALYVTSSVLLHYGLEVRSYAMVLFFTLGAMHFFVCLYMDVTNKKRNILLHALMNLLMFFTHYLTVLLFAVQGLSALVLHNKNNSLFRNLIISFCITLAAILPWVLLVYNKLPLGGQSWMQPPNFNELLQFFAIYSGGWKWFYAFAVFIIVSGILFAFKPKFAKPQFKQSIFFTTLIWAVLPMLILFIYSQKSPAFHSRYTLYAVPGLLVCVVYIFYSWKLNTFLKIAFAVFTVFSLFKIQNINYFANEDWRKAMPLIKQERNENTLTIISANYQEGVFAYHFRKDIFKDYTEINTSLKNQNIYAAGDASQLGFMQNISPKKVILVQTQHLVTDPQNTIADTLQKLYPRQKIHDFYGVKVSVYNK